MNGENAPWDPRLRDLDAAWAASRYHPVPSPASSSQDPTNSDSLLTQSVRYNPHRTVSQPLAFRTYPRPPSHGRSYSRPNSRPTSSHGTDGPPPSFLSHVRKHRRKSSGSYDRAMPRVLSRRNRLWPPDGYSRRSTLEPKKANDLICEGASTFSGYRDEIQHSPGHYKFFAVLERESNSRTDRATFQDAAFQDITLTMTGPTDGAFPWSSLEQPCMASAFAKSPGTTTLTFYIGKSGSLHTRVQYGSRAKARKMKLIAILERLRDLELCGLQEDNFEWTYRFLYERLIEDPEADTDPHYDRAMQMADLLTVLSNPDWIDFSLPRNQVVAKFFDSQDEKIKRKFFHQLLLAIELYLRIEAPEHEEKNKRKLLSQLPPKVAWDLALAQRWLQHMSISRVQLSQTQSTFTFDLMSKKRQKEALRTFASLLKWPNMEELDYILEENDPQEKSIEDRSADTMSWFTGVILPGPTLPFLLMNTLIDCDRDTGEELKYLTHIHPNAGFQYRANTYWSYQCIVGKVLGAGRGVKGVAGWIGPCHYTPELDRTQCVLIKQLDPPEQRLTSRDVLSMTSRTAPLGPEDQDYPISDYDMPHPNTHDVEDIIRIEKLSFTPTGGSESRSTLGSATGRGARTYTASIVFAFAGMSRPIKLKYNVDFIYAYPCANGPHPLYHEYKHRVVKVDQGLIDIHTWGQRNRRTSRANRDNIYKSQPSSPSLRPGHYNAIADGDLHDEPEDMESAMALALKHQHQGQGHGHSQSLPLSHKLTTASNRARSTSPPTSQLSASSQGGTAQRYVSEVLVIEAFGVSDNEVFARAWCAQMGVSAIVANIRETCVGCAVREAYAANVSVVICTEGGREGEGDLGIEI